MAATGDSPHKNRTQIPNIVDDLGLDPYERALYVHYKRVCGENPGAYCYETTKTTAQKTKMSAAQVSMSRRALALRGLVIVQDSRPVVVTIVNIWELNTDFYQLEHRPIVDGWDVEQIKRWLYDMSSDVHTVNIGSHNDSDTRSYSEPELTELASGVHTVNEKLENVHCMNVNGDMSSYVHTVKQRIEESLIQESNPSKESNRESESHTHELSENEKLGKQLNDICEFDTEAITNGTERKLAKALSFLIRKKATPELVQRFRNEYWWGTSPPKPDQVTEEWNIFINSLTTKEPQRKVVRIS